MGCVKSKQIKQESCDEAYKARDGENIAIGQETAALKFVNFKEPPVAIKEIDRLPELKLDLNLICSDRNVLSLKYPLTPSFRRVKQERTLIKRHSAPEPKRGAFPSGLRLNIVNNVNLYQHPETTRQQQLSSVLKSIDDILEIPDLATDIIKLLNCLRGALFNSNVDATVAQGLLHSIKKCNTLSTKQLSIDLSKPNEMINTQYSFSQSQNELIVVTELIRCVPKLLVSLRLTHFQISSERLTELGYSISSCRALVKLSLKACSLNDQFIEVFTKELGKGNTLYELDISSNFIRDIGLCKLGLFLLSGKSHLAHLDISQNFFTKEAIESFDLMLLASSCWDLRLLSESKILDSSIEAAFKSLYRKQFKKRKTFHKYRLLTTETSETISYLINRVCDYNHSVSLDYLTENDRKRNVGMYLTKGHRPSMEDYILFYPQFTIKQQNHSLYGIFDGHGGVETARLSSFLLKEFLERELHFTSLDIDGVKKKEQNSSEVDNSEDNGAIIETALKASFQQTQKFLESFGVPHGSCALVVYKKDNIIYTANSGDSQALLIEISPTSSVKPVFSPLGVIKHPTDADELKRIEDANGLVLRGRVDGTIAVSRALGDLEYQPKITYRPIVSRRNLPNGEDTVERVVVLASDGLWDNLTDEQVALFVKDYLFKTTEKKRRRSLEPGLTLTEVKEKEDSYWELAKALSELALTNGSSDNISVICLAV